MDQSDEKEMDFEEDEVGTVDSEWEFLLHKISDHSELVEPEEDSSDEEEDNPSHSLNRVDHVSNQHEGQEEFDQKEKEEEYRLGHNDEKKDQGRKREVTKTRWGEEDCLEERVMANSASEVADEEANFQYMDEEVEYVDEYIDEEAEEETETYCSSVEHDDKENSIDITYDGASEQCSEPSMVSNEWDGANGEEGLTMEEVKRIALREEATEDNQVLNGHDTGCEAEKRKQTCQSKHFDAEPGYDQCNTPLETVGFSNISEVSLECTASVPYASISQSLTVGDEDQRLCTRSSSTCKINQDLLLKSEDFDPEDSEGNQLSDDQFQSKKRHSVHQKEDQFLKDEFVKLPFADKTLISFQKNDKDSDGSPPAKKFKLEFEIKTNFEKTEESKKADLDTDLLKGCLPMAEESTQLVSRLTGGDSLHKLKDPVEQLALSSTSGNYETELFADMSTVDIPVDISGKISEDKVVMVKDIFETGEMEFDLAVSPLSNVSEKMTMHSINQFTADDIGKECSDTHAEDECCHNTRDKQSDLHSETYTNKPDNVDFSLTNGDTSTFLTDHSCHQRKSEEKQVGHFDCSSSSAIEYAPEENEKMCQNERKDANLGYLEEKFPSADTKDVAASSISDRQPLEDATDIATSQISATQPSEDATDIATSPISATQPSEDATDIATSPISATQPLEDATDIATSPISATQPSEDAMDIATSTISATQPPEDAVDIATSPVPDTQSSENSKDVATTLDGQDLIDAKDIATSSVTDTQLPENTQNISKSLVSDTQSSEDSKGVATTLDIQYSEDAKDCEISLASETQPSNAEEEIPHVLEVDKSTQMWADIEAQRRQGMLIGVSLQPLHKTDLPKLLVLFNEVSSDYEIYMRGGRTKGSAFLSMSQTSRMKDLMNGLISVGSLTNRFLFWGLKNISLHPGFEVFCTLDLAPKKTRRSDMIRQVTSDSPDREMYEVSFGDLPAGIPSVTFKDLFPMALGVQYDFEKSDRTKKQCALSIEGCQLRLLFASEKTMYQCLDLYVHICVNGRNLNSSYSGFWRSDQCLGAVTVPAAQEVYRIPRGVNVTYYYLRAEKNDQRITYPTVTLNPAAAKSLQRKASGAEERSGRKDQ